MCVAVQNRQKITKTFILGVHGYSRSSMLTFLRSLSIVLVIVSRMSVPICSCFHASQYQWNNHFLEKYPSFTLACAGLLEPKGSALWLLKSAFNAEISYAGCLRLPSGSSSQFTLEMCAAAKHCETFTKDPPFGGPRSFKVIDVNKIKKSVTNACYGKQHVCTYLQPFSH